LKEGVDSDDILLSKGSQVERNPMRHAAKMLTPMLVGPLVNWSRKWSGLLVVVVVVIYFPSPPWWSGGGNPTPFLFKTLS